MKAIGYMPLLRPGATLFSAVVIHNRMFQSSNYASSLEAIYGKEGKRYAVDILGNGTGRAARRLFGPSASARQVLEQHTLFGVYSRAMTPHVANSLADQLIDGNSSRFRWAFRGHRRRQIPRLATMCLRSCERCIDEDINLQGFPSWRVLHLLPSIGHCPQHGVALRDEGPESTDGYRHWNFALPGEQQSILTGAPAMQLPVSDGYAAYLQLWLEAFSGDLTGIAPDVWNLVMDAVVTHFGTIGYACEKISSTIESSWEARLDDIARCLGIADGSLFIRAELEQRVQASYVASRLVIVGALDALKIGPPRRENSPWRSPIPLSNVKTFGSWLTPQTQEDLRRCVMDANFPPALFREMAEDMDVYTIDRRLRLDRIILRRFFQTIPDELLERVSTEQSWSRSSWLMKELGRREAAWSSGGR